jgi:hypothetical protein
MRGSVWTTKRDAILKREFEDGHTYDEIAREIGVSKSSIAGRVHRLGLRRGLKVDALGRNVCNGWDTTNRMSSNDQLVARLRARATRVEPLTKNQQYDMLRKAVLNTGGRL